MWYSKNLIITGTEKRLGIGVLVETGPGNTGSSVKIINCQITCLFSGIFVQPRAMVEIEGSRILNNSGYGVLVESSGDEPAGAAIEKTQIRNNGVGVCLTGSRGRAKIWDSSINHNKEDGIRVASSNLGVLNNNDISFNGNKGVVFEEGSCRSIPLLSMGRLEF